jgi:hypothetical protein
MVTSIGGRKFPVTLSASETLYIGNGSDRNVATAVVQIVGSGWTGSIEVKGRVTGSGLATADLETIAYKTFAAPGSFATAALTADSLIAIPMDGIDAYLDYTHTAGSVTIYLALLDG